MRPAQLALNIVRFGIPVSRRTRVITYSCLFVVVITAFGATRYGIMFLGFDPYFLQRETGNIQILHNGDRTLLWGGEDPESHFDITEFRLNPEHLEYGLGREAFTALVHPTFTTVKRADKYFEDDQRVLVVTVKDVVKIYALATLRRHEVVNDVIAGRPIFTAFCPLANLAGVYDREYDGQPYTFAVSGYTYFDWRYWRGYSAFVLWDRETESLWWPPMGKAVSGPSIDTPLQVFDSHLWAQSRWGEAKLKYPDAKVLEPFQGQAPITDWPKASPPRVSSRSNGDESGTVPPRWGKKTE
jgi:Protein of unknown function (DUF3179)